MQEFAPVIEVDIAAKPLGEGMTLVAALAGRAPADGPVRVAFRARTNQAVLWATDERQLDRTVASLREQLGAVFTVGPLRVRYLATIERPATVDYTHKKIHEGGGEFAHVKLRVEPIRPEDGLPFAIEARSYALPEEFAAGIKKGIDAGLGAGIMAGYPVVVRVSLIDAKHHDTDSSPLAFEIAAHAALREAL